MHILENCFCPSLCFGIDWTAHDYYTNILDSSLLFHEEMRCMQRICRNFKDVPFTAKHMGETLFWKSPVLHRKLL